MKRTRLIRKQLDDKLRKFQPLLENAVPASGWIRSIRDSLGMSARQLGIRVGVAQQRVAAMEKEERTGALTMKTMRRAAESLGCVFVYGFVPRTGLENIVMSQAKLIARQRLARASHTMNLEAQALGPQENEEILSEMIDELVEKSPGTLWEAKE